jgi:prepilin-type N-terminal cleavage/methylation domain-containing protein
MESRKHKAGFTMVELLVAMAIIGLLIATAIWGIGTAQQSARNTQRRSTAANILAGLSEYYSRYNKQALSVCGINTGLNNGCIVITKDANCSSVTAANCTATTTGYYAIPTNGAQTPIASGILNVAPVATAYINNATSSSYLVLPNYSSGGVKGYQVCAYLEGGGVANLSEPQSIPCP